jgi:hypothetical protein
VYARDRAYNHELSNLSSLFRVHNT